MTRKAILLAAAMTCMAASVSAQFVAEKNNGETVTMGGNNLTITQKGDADEWTILCILRVLFFILLFSVY